MSVKIRLSKTGKKHQISYRIVAQDSKSKRDGKFLELLGYHLPYREDKKSTNIKKDRLDYWLSKGAQLTVGVAKLIRQSGNQALGPSGKNPENPVT